MTQPLCPACGFVSTCTLDDFEIGYMRVYHHTGAPCLVPAIAWRELSGQSILQPKSKPDASEGGGLAGELQAAPEAASSNREQDSEEPNLIPPGLMRDTQ